MAPLRFSIIQFLAIITLIGLAVHAGILAWKTSEHRSRTADLRSTLRAPYMSLEELERSIESHERQWERYSTCIDALLRVYDEVTDSIKAQPVPNSLSVLHRPNRFPGVAEKLSLHVSGDNSFRLVFELRQSFPENTELKHEVVLEPGWHLLQYELQTQYEELTVKIDDQHIVNRLTVPYKSSSRSGKSFRDQIDFPIETLTQQSLFEVEVSGRDEECDTKFSFVLMECLNDR